MHYVYVHGWGFDASFWQPLMARLGEGTCVDLGYVATQQTEIPQSNEPIVAICHSFGTQFMLHRSAQHNLAAFIAINGFARFTKAADFPDGVHPKLLKRMIQGFAQKPQTVFADFMGQCGVDTPDEGDFNTARLAQDLDAMLDGDERGQLQALKCPVLALAGSADQVVSADMSRAAFEGYDLHMKEGGDHVLPLSAPDWCAERIGAFVEGLPQ